MKNAFTLAEVLVTLGIIGVVAAMTVPNLMENYQRQSYVTQLRKVYSELSQAAETAMTENNTQRLSEVRALRQSALTFLTTYFKTVQSCTSSNLTECLADEYTTLSGVEFPNTLTSNDACAVLASGSTLCLRKLDSSLIATVDINGKQPPNIYGRDLFILSVDSDGSVTSTVSPDSATLEGCMEGEYGVCFAQILRDGWIMDY